MDFETDNFWHRFKLPIVLSLVGLVLIIGGVFSSGLNKSSSKDLPAGKQGFSKESLVSKKLISVDVSGSVKNPGVYKLEDGSRIEEAINSAGGFSDEGDPEYISKHINLAQKLLDGSKVYIPKKGETFSSNSAGSVAGVSAGKININTSSQSELESLPGVGPSTASKIIADRPYQQAEELLSKKIVGKAVFEKIKELITVY